MSLMFLENVLVGVVFKPSFSFESSIVVGFHLVYLFRLVRGIMEVR